VTQVPEALILHLRTVGQGRMAKREKDHIVETATEARGAERGPTVRNVLVWSLGLVVVAFIVVYLIFFKT
jgi:hypothetical protein